MARRQHDVPAVGSPAQLGGDHSRLVDLTLLLESFPTRVRGTAIGLLGAMFSGGPLLGSGVWTALTGHVPPLVVWYGVALAFSVIQLVLTLALPDISPGPELEAIAT